MPGLIVACAPAQVSVFVTGTGGKLDAWMDFARAARPAPQARQIFTSQAVTPGVNLLTFTVPCSAKVGTSYARFRLSSAGGLRDPPAPPTTARSRTT